MSSLVSRWSEPLGPDGRLTMPESEQLVGHGLHEWGRATHENLRLAVRLEATFSQHVAVHPPIMPHPSLGGTAGERMDEREAIAVCHQLVQLIPINDVLERARRIEKSCRRPARGLTSGPQHRHEGHHSRTAGDQHQWHRAGWIPGEIPANRPAELDGISRAKLLSQKRRYFTV